MTSLAKVMAKCFVNEPSIITVQDVIVPQLNRLLTSSRKEVAPFLADVHELRTRAPELKKLLFISHMDFGMSNIMV